MGYPVTRLRYMDAEFFAGGHEKGMVVGILAVGLEKVVVDILRRQFHLDPGNLHCYEFQHRHSAGSILEERMVDFYSNLPAGDKLTFDKVGLKDLRREIFGHSASFGG